MDNGLDALMHLVQMDWNELISMNNGLYGLSI